MHMLRVFTVTADGLGGVELWNQILSAPAPPIVSRKVENGIEISQSIPQNFMSSHLVQRMPRGCYRLFTGQISILVRHVGNYILPS